MAKNLEDLFGGTKKSNQKSFIDAYSKFFGKLGFLLDGVASSKLRWKPNPKQFSVREMICHFVEHEALAITNLNSMLCASSENPPKLVELDTIALSEKCEYNEQNELYALDSLKYIRKYMTEVLKGLSDAQFEKTGILANGKTITLKAFLEAHNEHTANHLREMELLVEDLKMRD
ncbi:hypothetical protein Ctha_1257 [Chloroherpeton thalassium ATCC 35110]|uniref:DinB-like domain-containing protein n=1 Tax=Chloroherpeton thalassium (strain ATCC 35110 / GB-78) TaxID=517418 RepID=B3QZ27_CHLT3|nr:DinB family protein [Chloroherpeton thalassium]ACF13720.1 hypothetical protein Ctha_1257 [Chloroherpeton thalassium ATCC 35110]